MTRQLFSISSLTILIALCMFLPHMPGDYDILAPTLSFIAPQPATTSLEAVLV
ncbi:hypothetical protein [Agriterribacter humi]|uniref:hypothetical protein n=1 Tax=Agriterribacter humi TaxID=1104781 RepID=UPI00186B573A|nr:hypothetical protein [Agriterribacter humi]